MDQLNKISIIGEDVDLMIKSAISVARELKQKKNSKILIMAKDGLFNNGYKSRKTSEVSVLINHLDEKKLSTLIEPSSDGIAYVSIDSAENFSQIFSQYPFWLTINPDDWFDRLSKGECVLRLLKQDSVELPVITKEIAYCEEHYIPLVKYALFVADREPTSSFINLIKNEVGKNVLSKLEIGDWLVNCSSDEESDIDKIKIDLLQELLRFLEPFAVAGDSQNRLKDIGRDFLKKTISRLSENYVPSSKRGQFIESILSEAMGYGPLEEMMKDNSVSEIMVNGTKNIFVERGGRLEETQLYFSSANQLRRVIDKMLSPVGRRVDESSPLVDARLYDGSRLNVVIPPLTIGEPVVTIRRFNKCKFSPEQLVAGGMLEQRMLDFLLESVKRRASIIISGGTGSGKTTLLETLASGIDEGERIITVEDTSELVLKHKHVVRLEGRPSNIEGKGEVTIRQLVRNALRMRPDRIVVGECRGAEALDMLQAMNTGHEGSMTTIHSNSARDCLSRLETMVLLAGSALPLNAIRDQIGSAVHLIVQVARLSSGRRAIVEISEVTGREGERIALKELVIYRDDSFIYSGWLPGRNLPPIK